MLTFEYIAPAVQRLMENWHQLDSPEASEETT